MKWYTISCDRPRNMSRATPFPRGLEAGVLVASGPAGQVPPRLDTTIVAAFGQFLSHASISSSRAATTPSRVPSCDWSLPVPSRDFLSYLVGGGARSCVGGRRSRGRAPRSPAPAGHRPGLPRSTFGAQARLRPPHPQQAHHVQRTSSAISPMVEPTLQPDPEPGPASARQRRGVPLDRVSSYAPSAITTDPGASVPCRPVERVRPRRLGAPDGQVGPDERPARHARLPVSAYACDCRFRPFSIIPPQAKKRRKKRKVKRRKKIRRQKKKEKRSKTRRGERTKKRKKSIVTHVAARNPHSPPGRDPHGHAVHQPGRAASMPRLARSSPAARRRRARAPGCTWTMGCPSPKPIPRLLVEVILQCATSSHRALAAP